MKQIRVMVAMMLLMTGVLYSCGNEKTSEQVEESITVGGPDELEGEVELEESIEVE